MMCKIIDFKKEFYDRLHEEWTIYNRLLNEYHDLTSEQCRKLAEQILKQNRRLK